MLKAYKELEHLGLVAARPGIGVFVTKTLTGDSLAAHGPLRQDLRRWLSEARRAGLDEESIAPPPASSWLAARMRRPP